MKKITTSDMVSLATKRATDELRQSERKAIDNFMNTGDSLKQYFKEVTGENIEFEEPESDRDMLADLVSLHESENI